MRSLKASYTNIDSLLKCTKKVLKKHSKIQEYSFIKSGVSITADLSIDLLTSKTYSIHNFDGFIEQHIMTFALTNIFFIIFDCYDEFSHCTEEVCEVES